MSGILHARRHYVNSSMRPLPNPAIEVEAFRSWLLAGRAAGSMTESLDRELATAMSEGVPAAWALFQDVVKPRMIGALFPLCHDSKIAVDIADAVSARLYQQRTEPATRGLAGLPSDIPLFALCRAHVLIELEQRERGAKESNAPGDRFDAIATARTLLANGGVEVRAPSDALAGILALEGRIPPDLRELDLGEQLERQRRSTRDLSRTVRILNLPAVLVLVFFVTLTAAGAYIATSSRDDGEQVAESRVREAILSGRFDEALRQLADEPPAGLARLAPLRPESRVQRVRELRARNPVRPMISILSPHGRIDSPSPKIILDRDPAFTAEVKIRMVDAFTGSAVLQRTASTAELVIDPQVQLPRGGAYIISVEGGEHAARAQFEVLTEDVRMAVERRIGDVTSQFVAPEPALLNFLRAHVYRAEECFEASLAEWRALAKEFESKSYPLEEAACIFDSEFRLPWHAVAELSRNP